MDSTTLKCISKLALTLQRGKDSRAPQADSLPLCFLSLIWEMAGLPCSITLLKGMYRVKAWCVITVVSFKSLCCSFSSQKGLCFSLTRCCQGDRILELRLMRHEDTGLPVIGPNENFMRRSQDQLSCIRCNLFSGFFCFPFYPSPLGFYLGLGYQAQIGDDPLNIIPIQVSNPLGNDHYLFLIFQGVI